MARYAALPSGMRISNDVSLRRSLPPCPTGRGEEAAVPSPPSTLSLFRPPFPFEAIEKEKQGEFIKKIFRETKGKHSSRGAQRHVMAWHSVELTLEVDK